MNISAEGDIHEAYSAFIILNKATPNFKSSKIEDLVYQFLIGDGLVTGVKAVDSASGMLQGDVSKNNIEYAIKSLDASILSLQQIDKLAQEIVKSKGEFDINKLRAKKEELRKKGRTRNKIRSVSQDNLNDLLELLELK